MIYGGIEAGGTKFNCCIGDENGNIIEKIRIATTNPKETMEQVISFFDGKGISSIGVGSFGPIELDTNKDNYGTILKTPKLEWRNFNIVECLKEHFNVPILVTTDVNVACLGEVKLGSSIGLSNVLYMTIGTGVGVGAIINGKFLQTASHPEMGHIYINQRTSDTFKGNCPTHGACLEGLISGPALYAKYGKKAEELLDDDSVWDEVGFYAAQAIYNYSLILNPERVIIGGGVGLNDQVLKNTKKYFVKLNNGYLSTTVLCDIDSYIVPASLGSDAGMKGAIMLAIEAKNNEK